MYFSAFLIIIEKNKPDRSIGEIDREVSLYIVSGQKAHDMGVASLSDSVKIYNAWSIRCCVHE